MRRSRRALFALLWLAAPGRVLADPAMFDVPADTAVVRATIADLTDRLARQPTHAALYVQRGEAHFKSAEFERAVADFNAALRLDDRLDDAYFGRGMARGRNGELDDAIADLSVYIQRNPDSSVAHTKRGVRYLWRGDAQAAERDFLKALALDPKNAEAHDDLGVIYAQRGEYDKATKHFSTCIKLDPSYHKAYHNYALVCYITGPAEQGLVLVDQALALLPTAKDSMLLKAELLERLGRVREANALREDAEFLPDGNWSERSAIQ
jgi:tetratricopeptide (TPR) repeat protein